MNIIYVVNGEDSTYYFQERNAIKKFLNSTDVNGKNIILKFSAKWCAPCKYSTSHLEKLLAELKNNKLSGSISLTKNINDVIIIDIDVDKYENIASYFRVQSLPTIVTYFNGNIELVRNSTDYHDWKNLFNLLH